MLINIGLHILMFLVFASYGYLALQGRILVEDIEAGPTDNKDRNYFRRKSFYVHSSKYSNLPNGETFDERKHFLVKVDGDCLVPKGISNGMLLCAERITGLGVKEGDVLVLHIADKGFSILRIVDYTIGDTIYL